MNLELSELDSNRFGFPCARSIGWAQDGIKQIDSFCRSNKVKLLILRLDVKEIAASCELQNLGAVLLDNIVYCSKSLVAKNFQEPNKLVVNHHIRDGRESDYSGLSSLGRHSFSNYIGHYHNDPNIDNSICNDIYADWCSSFSTRAKPQSFFVLESDRGKINGVAGLKYHNDTCDGELFAVSPDARGVKGFSALLNHSMKSACANGANFFSYSTQIQNTLVLNSLFRRGFQIDNVVNTYHLWCEV